MSKTIYRKAALERLSSPEQLDQTIPITNPRAWLVLGAVVALLLAAAFWGIFGTITTQVSSRSIMVNSGGIRNVVATHPGQISALSPAVGDTLGSSSSIISEGDVVAWVNQPGEAESQEIISPYTGRILEVKANKGDLVEIGDSLLSLEFVGDEVELEAVLFLPATQAGSVRPGMEVRFSPDATLADVSGYIEGRIATVGDFPSSRESLLRILGSDEMIQALSVSQAPIEIHVELLRDPDSPDGLQWSSPVDEDTGFRSGSLGTAVIIVDERRPISYLVSGS
jgi:hypothetical protein